MKLDEKTKQPYAIALKDGGLFALAGLWETWKDKATGESKDTYTVITTDPNELMSPENGPPIHDRMPVILAPQDYDRWMAPADTAHLQIALLRPFPADQMKAWKVSSDVGNVRNNRPDLCGEIT
jgi:putative SOS response-associated peptidase YedK